MSRLRIPWRNVNRSSLAFSSCTRPRSKARLLNTASINASAYPQEVSAPFNVLDAGQMGHETASGHERGVGSALSQTYFDNICVPVGSRKMARTDRYPVSVSQSFSSVSSPSSSLPGVKSLWCFGFSQYWTGNGLWGGYHSIRTQVFHLDMEVGTRLHLSRDDRGLKGRFRGDVVYIAGRTDSRTLLDTYFFGASFL